MPAESMPAMPLTDKEISNAKPVPKPFKLTDGGWLFMFVSPSSSKLWRMAYRFDGKEKTLSLGSYPQLGLKDARTKRDEAKALLASCLDPSQQRQRDKIPTAISTANDLEGATAHASERRWCWTS